MIVKVGLVNAVIAALSSTNNITDAQLMASQAGSSFAEGNRNECAATGETPFDPSLSTLDLSQFNPYGTESLSEAWFSQHVINLDAMDFGQDYS